MKTDKLLQLIQQKNPKRSGGALPLPKAQDGGKTKDKVTYIQPKLVNVKDPQTGEITQVDTSDPKYKEMYPRLMNVDEQGNLSRTLPEVEVKVRPNVSGCVGGMCYEMGENSGKSLDTFRHRNNLYGDAWTILNNAYGTDIKLDTKDFSNLKVNDVVNLTREAFDSDAEKGIPAANQHVGFISKVVDGVPYVKHFIDHQYYEEPINDINAVFKYQPTRVKRLADYQDLNVQPSSFKFDQGYEPNNIEEGFLKGSQQKPDLQKVLSLNTDDYDNLEKLAYGIMYNEGKFGRSKKTLYRMAVPDFLQKAVKVADDIRRGVNVYDENINNLSQGYSSTKESTLHGVSKTDKNDKRTPAEINKAVKEGDYSGLERTNNYLYYVLGEMGLNPDNLENGENSYKAVMANLSWLKKRYPDASNETLVKMYTGKKNVSSYEKSVEKAQRNIDNNPNNNLTYSAGEKFYGALSNLANKVNSGAKTVSSKTVGVLRDVAPTPITVNALLGDIAGSKEPITEKSLSNVTLDKLKEIVKNQVSQGKYTLDYNSYFPELSRDQRLGVSGGANDESGVVEKISRATSPGGMLQNFLGQANIVDLGNGEYEITDSYDFNDKGKSFGVMDDLIKRGASPYAIPRAIGRNFGSQDNQGAPVRIKVKLQEGGVTDPYIGMRKFYDDAYDALGKYENEQGEVSPFNVNRAWAKAAVKNPYLLFRDRHNLAEQGFSDDEIMSATENPYHKDSPVIRMSGTETRYQYPTDYVLPNEKDVERYNKYLANKAQQKSPKGNGFDLSDEWKDIKRGVRNASRDVRHFIGKEVPRALRNCVNGDCYEFHQEGGSASNEDGLYNQKRADELGYQRDEQGHLPSVDYTNGMWLKSKEHPTAWMEYFHGQLNPEVANQYNVRLNPEGYFGENQLQYVPKKQLGGSPLQQQLINQALGQTNPASVRSTATVAPKNLQQKAVAKDIAEYGSVEKAEQAKAIKKSIANQRESTISTPKLGQGKYEYYNPEQLEYRDDKTIAPQGSLRGNVQNNLNAYNEFVSNQTSMLQNLSGPVRGVGAVAGIASDLFINGPIQSGINIANTLAGDRSIRGDEDFGNLFFDAFNAMPVFSSMFKGAKTFNQASRLANEVTFSPTPGILPKSFGNLFGETTVPQSGPLRNLQDLQAAQKFAKKYGYELPKDINRIAESDVLTDRTVRGLMSRHNTMVRGVSTNWEVLGRKNPQIIKDLENLGFNLSTEEGSKAAAEYMSTHIPGNTGYGRFGLKPGEDALYLSNSIPAADGYTYGDGFIVKVRRPVDFSSSNRLDWINKNNFDASLGFKNSPHGTGIVKNDYVKRIPTNFRELLATTGDPKTFDDVQKVIKEAEEKYREIAHESWKKHNNEIAKYRYENSAAARRGVYEYDGKIKKDELNDFDKYYLSFLEKKKNFMNNYYGNAPAIPIIKHIMSDADIWKSLGKNIFGKLDPFSHYAVKGTPGQKVFDAVQSIRVTPETWKNTSRMHVNKYSNKLTRREEGGSLSRAQKGLANFGYENRMPRETTSTIHTPPTGYNFPKVHPVSTWVEDLMLGAVPVLGDAVDFGRGTAALKEGDNAHAFVNYFGAALPFVAGSTLQSGYDTLGEYLEDTYVNKPRKSDVKKAKGGPTPKKAAQMTNAQKRYFELLINQKNKK